MSSSADTPRRRWFRKYLLIAVAAALALLVALAWYATTESFQAMVRHRLVAELQRVTGGRVELGSFHTVPFRFQVDVRNLTIHGREQADDIPYAHIDRLLAHVKLISVLGAEFGFDSLLLDRPVLHIIVYPDGSTNQPWPKSTGVDSRTQLDRLFSLSVNRLEVHQGELLWNDHKIPLDFNANDVSASMYYSLLHRRYDGTLLVGKIDTKFDNFRPLAWTTEAHFEFGEDSLRLNSLKAISRRSHLQASGRMVDFREPSWVGDYDLTIDMADLGAIARVPQMQRGTVQASGRGSWSKRAFSTTGTLQAKDLNWRDESFRLQASSLTSQFTINPQRLALSDIKAQVFAGEVNGDAQVINWRNPLVTAKADRGSEERGSVRLRAKDLSVQEIAVALSSAGRPLRQMNLAGDASGAIETSWKGSPHNADSKISLDVIAPDHVRPDQLPLNAHAQAIYRMAPAELEVSEFSASTRATQVRASGTLSTHAALSFSVATTNFGEWEDVLAALGYQEGFPFTMRGRAALNGIATGRLSEIDLAGKLQSQNFQVVIPASSNTPRREIRWDSLASDVQLSPHGFVAHNGTLHHGNAVIRFEVNAGLDQRQFTESSPFTATLQMHDADAAEVLAIAGYNYAVSGKLSLSLQATGTRASPLGQGLCRLSSATIRGAAVQQVESKFTFNRQQLSLQDIHLASNEGQIAGNGTYEFATRNFRLDVDGRNFELARFPALESTRVAVNGWMDFLAQASGTPDQPVVNAKLHLRDLSFDHQLVGDYNLDAVTKGSELRVSGRSQFKDMELNVDGNVLLRADWPAKLDLHLNAMNLDPFLDAYSKGRVNAHSTVTGDLQLQGPLRNPRELLVNGNITDFLADLQHVQLRNNGPIRFEISQQTLNIQRFRLIGEGTDLEIGGSAQLSGNQALHLNAEGHADLVLIHSLNPDFNTSGIVAVNLMANGTLQRPAMQGRLQITGGSIQYSDLPSALSDFSGSLIFNQDRLQVETLTAHVGGQLWGLRHNLQPAAQL
jgi:translocation and assembly module TamB